MKEIKLTLDDILRRKDMTQAQLAEITGLRKATISEIVNNQRSTINKRHLEKIIEALNIDDLSELLILTDEEK